jgi:hypothetical protein
MMCTRRLGSCLILVFLSALAFGQYYDASDLVYSGGTSSADQAISNAISAIPANGTGIVDASRLGPNLTFNANPFAVLSSTQGRSNPVACGVLLTGGGQTITLNAPIVVPTCWRVENRPSRTAGTSSQNLGTTFIPGPATATTNGFPPCIAPSAPCATSYTGTTNEGTVTTSAATCTGQQCLITVTGTGTKFISGLSQSLLWSHFGVCVGTSGSWGSACAGAANSGNVCNANGKGSGGTNNCLAWGLIVAIASDISMTVAVPSVGSGQGAGQGCPGSSCITANNSAVNYVIWAPVVSLGDMNSSGYNFGVQWEGGAINTALSQNINTNGAAFVACANYIAQEESWFRNVQCQGAGTGSLQVFDTEGAAYNAGPYDNVLVTSQNSCNSSSILIINRIPVTSSFSRPFQNSTITGTACDGGLGVNVAVDWETPAQLGPGIHIENGTGSATATVDVNDNPTCPVFCIMPTTNAQEAHMTDVQTTVIGSGATFLRVGSTASGFGIEVDHLRSSAGTLFTDINTGCSIPTSSGIPNWTLSTAYTLDQLILPTSGNAGNFIFKASVAGTSGGAAPTWPQAVGLQVGDNGVTWINIGSATEGILTRYVTTPSVLTVSVMAVSSSVTFGCRGNPNILWEIPSAAVKANIAATTMSSGIAGTHAYRLSWYVDLVTPGTGCTAGTTVVLNEIFTDPNASASTTLALTPSALTVASGNGVAGAVVGSGTESVVAKTSTAVQFSTTSFTAGTGCSPAPTYQVYPILELLW